MKKRFINCCKYDNYEEAKEILFRNPKLKNNIDALFWSIKNNNKKLTNLILKTI